MLLLFLSPDSFPFIRLLWEEYVHSFESYFIESQNHYVTKDLLRFLFQVTHSGLARIIKVLNISLLKTSQSPWATCVTVQPPSYEKTSVQMGFLFFNVLPLPILLWVNAAESVFYTAPIRFSNTWRRTLSHLFSTLNTPHSLISLICHHMKVFQALSNHVLDLLQQVL